MIPRTLRALGLALMTGLVAATPSWADATAELNLQDDATTLDGRFPPSVVSVWRNQLGVDSVRITARWNELEPAPGAFNFGSLDRAVSLVTSNGMSPLITLTTIGPVHASQEPGRNDGTYKPDPVKFGRFAGAVAQRYAGSVYRYTIGNEPNQGTFLNPQRVGGRPFSPHWYRQLVHQAYPQIKANDRSSQVLIGVMAPIGGTSPGAPSVAPLIFLRELGCVNATYRPVRTGYCAGFRPARGDDFAYHPYTIRFRLSPFAPTNPNFHVAGTGDLPRFFGVLDNVHRRGGLSRAAGGRFNVYFTEYGYETRPPDPRYGFPEAVQSRYLQESAYISWRTPRIKMHNQYLYFDDPDFYRGGSNVTFQTGIVFRNQQPKAAHGAFPHPIYVDIRPPFNRNRARIWGQVRPGGATTVTIEYSAGCAAYSAVATARTNFRGYFSRVQAVRRGCYRFRYPGGTSDPRRV